MLGILFLSLTLKSSTSSSRFSCSPPTSDCLTRVAKTTYLYEFLYIFVGYFFKKMIYLKSRFTENERHTERKILSVGSLCKRLHRPGLSQDEACSLSCVDGRSPKFGPSSANFSGTLADIWLRSQTVRARNDDYRGCQNFIQFWPQM